MHKIRGLLRSLHVSMYVHGLITHCWRLTPTEQCVANASDETGRIEHSYLRRLSHIKYVGSPVGLGPNEYWFLVDIQKDLSQIVQSLRLFGRRYTRHFHSDVGKRLITPAMSHKVGQDIFGAGY